MANILLCHDGSEGAVHAVEEAKRLGLFKNHYVFILTVVPEANVMAGMTAGSDYIQDLIDYETDETKVRLEEFGRAIEGHCLNYCTTYRIGDPAREILSFEKENDIDLIIMGSRGLSKLSRTVLGSVSQKVSNNCRGSIFVAKTPI